MAAQVRVAVQVRAAAQVTARVAVGRGGGAGSGTGGGGGSGCRVVGGDAGRGGGTGRCAGALHRHAGPSLVWCVVIDGHLDTIHDACLCRHRYVLHAVSVIHINNSAVTHDNSTVRALPRRSVTCYVSLTRRRHGHQPVHQPGKLFRPQQGRKSNTTAAGLGSARGSIYRTSSSGCKTA